jgi:hypothetical protein
MPNTDPLAFAANRLPDIHLAEPRTTADDACIAEVKAVLKRHRLDGKYGLTLMHKHFDLGPDEIMVEHTDLATRTLTSRPEKLGSIASKKLIEVTWSLDDDVLMAGCVWKCYVDSNATPPHSQHHADPTDDSGGTRIDLQ